MKPIMFIFVACSSSFIFSQKTDLEQKYNPTPSIYFDSERIDKQTGRLVHPTLAVMNYTLYDTAQSSIEALDRHRVSAHYVIDTDGTTHELVHPKHRAYHAGVGIFKPINHHPTTDINSHSIGILFVNKGCTDNPQDEFAKLISGGNGLIKKDKPTYCYPYTKEQISASIALLKTLRSQGYDIKHFVGHGEVAVSNQGINNRKIGPGPLFPWKELADDGFGLWPKADAEKIPTEHANIFWIQHALNKFGYNCPITGKLDEQTHALLKQFQMHYRPENVDGQFDTQTVQIIQNLLEQINILCPEKAESLPHQ